MTLKDGPPPPLCHGVDVVTATVHSGAPGGGLGVGVREAGVGAGVAGAGVGVAGTGVGTGTLAAERYQGSSPMAPRK